MPARRGTRAGPNIVPVIATARAHENRKLLGLTERVEAAAETKRLAPTASGILMERFGLSADESHRPVRYYARSNRITLEEAAERIVQRRHTFELLEALRRLTEKAVSG